MDPLQIFQQTFSKALNIPQNEIQENTRLKPLLAKLARFDILELRCILEANFQKAIPPKEFDSWESPFEAIQFIENKAQGKKLYTGLKPPC